jgi:hypothetical protein
VPTQGCPYFDRCGLRIPAGATVDPSLGELAPGHRAARLVAAQVAGAKPA